MGRKKQLPGIRYGFRILIVVKHFPDINLALISGEGHAKAEQELSSCLITTIIILSNIKCFLCIRH